MDVEATPFLLFGQHRSGTSFLHNVVKRHPRAFSINEPFSQHVPLFRTTELEEWDASAGDPEVPVAALAPESPLNDYLRELRKWLRAPYPAVRGFKETYLLH